MHVLRSLPVALLVLAAGCGGNVVFVEDGSGGGGSTGTDGTTVGTSSSVGTTTSVGTGSSCDLLQAQMDDAYRAAQACDPTIDTVQCDASAVLLDSCACPSIVANEHAPDLYAAAQQAYDAWVAGGCGPYACAACFPAQGGGCVPGSDGSGTCVAFGPD